MRKFESANKKPEHGKLHYHECSRCRKGFILGKNDIPDECLCEGCKNPLLKDIFLRETVKHVIHCVLTVLAFMIIAVITVFLVMEYEPENTSVRIVSWIFAGGMIICGLVLSGFFIVHFKKISHFILMRDEKLGGKISAAYIENVESIEREVSKAVENKDTELLEKLYNYAYKLSFVYDSPRLAMARFRCIDLFHSDAGVRSENERISAQLCVSDETSEDENLKKYIEDAAQADRSQIGYYSLKLYKRLFYQSELYERIRDEAVTEKLALSIKRRNPVLYNDGLRAANVFSASLVSIRSLAVFHDAVVKLIPFMRYSDRLLLKEIIQKEEADE